MDRMNGRPIVALLVFLPLAAFMSADEAAKQSSSNAYTHGFISCLEGSDGPGTVLFLRPDPECNSRMTYPYLEIDIRERPVPTNQKIIIGGSNWAFQCVDAKSACQQFSSGELMFNHFETVDKKGIHTDGWYELRFPSGLRETGQFTADCVAPCA
jgi:hypothetical protein